MRKCTKCPKAKSVATKTNKQTSVKKKEKKGLLVTSIINTTEKILSLVTKL